MSVPIVLAHGLCLFDRLSGIRPTKEYFRGVRSALEANGHRVLSPRVNPTASTASRAAELKAAIRRELGTQPVHVIGHSLGGLDARYMISRLGMDRQVASLTTVGTPHRGSTFADWMVARLARTLQPVFRWAGMSDDGVFDLMTDRCERFNEETPDAPGVRYFSVAGVCEKPWLGLEWLLPSRIVGRAEGLNDGVVSVASATWGERTDLWAGDHLNLVNWPNRRMRKAGAWRDRAADYVELVGRVASTANHR